MANILSSLKIKGASTTGGEGKNGFVPVLDSTGKLDASTIPLGLISQLIEIPPLTDMAVVDSQANAEIATGSFAAPFKTISAAATRGYSNFLLIGGSYGNDNVSIGAALPGAIIRIFSIGTSTFNNLTFSRCPNGAFFRFYDVSVTAKLEFSSDVDINASLLGYGATGTVKTASESSSLKLEIDSTYRVDNIDVADDVDVTVEYIAKSSRIENDSQAPGDTVADTLDVLSSRKIRIPVFTSDATGLHVLTTTDVSADLLTNTYILSAFGTELATAINNRFHKDGDSPSYNAVTASSVSVGTTELAEGSVKTDELKLSINGTQKAVVKIDSDNFLVIA